MILEQIKLSDTNRRSSRDHRAKKPKQAGSATEIVPSPCEQVTSFASLGGKFEDGVPGEEVTESNEEFF